MPPSTTQESNADAGTEIVKPYAIEEPDDEPNNKSHQSVLSCLPDNFERWHVDLIESMDDLKCESDESASALRRGQKRGQKRKPATTASAASSSIQQSSPQGSKCTDTQYEMPGLSRKPPRKRTKRPKEDASPEDYSSSAASNGSESYMSSSSALQSTDGSGAETDNMSSDPKADKMDID